MSQSEAVEGKVREIRRKTRRKYSAEEKIRIVLEELRGEESIAGLCRREGIAPNLYYSWSKEFLETGKRRMMGDTKRQATSGEARALLQENGQLKKLVADLSLKNVVLKKKLGWHGRRSGSVMRFTQAEKMEIIRLVEGSSLPVTQALLEMDVPRSSFYRWYRRYLDHGYDGLANQPSHARRF
ncbi:MAG: transposase [Desulfarculaceae bacterium]|nr:transposase [Desulfarculaceae bacterium]MCF8073136.1 transposase [Desulfarculaceae bacterium]MCF8101779.1 transposase [Desulfarculaceae bacterium]MCF8117343.1 transposase [Desulfarculaceae bacterium]